MKKRILLLAILASLLALWSRGAGKPEITEEKYAAVENTETAATEPTQETTMETTTETTTIPILTIPPAAEPEDGDFVKITDYIPTASQELFYATEHNFTGQVIYEFEDAYLRYGTVKKLAEVAEDLEELGLYLKIWDGFRPVAAQFRLWQICPDPTYVANPNKGFSSHSRGNTVDLTLVDGSGRELEMPTAFDDFSAKADRDYSDCSQTEKENAQLLEILMEKHGFTGYYGEWWHFSDTVSYPVEEAFTP